MQLQCIMGCQEAIAAECGYVTVQVICLCCCCSQGLQTHEDVKEYYGKYLKNSKYLRTNACVTPSKSVPKFIQDALTEVHEEVSSCYYGCGLMVPECLENCRILDLGSGSGRDCYMLSELVGPKGHITGIDMTVEQVKLSRNYIDYHMKKFGYQKANINFVNGYIEDLKAAGIGEHSYDIIIDVYSNNPVPDELKQNKVLWGECISGALSWNDLYMIAEEIGFSPPRLVTSSCITVNNKELEAIIGDLKFVSATFRLFKLPQNPVKEKGMVIYNGGITGYENEMQFDINFTFKEGEATSVDEDLWCILKTSRFSDEFLFQPSGKEITPAQCYLEKEIIKDPFQLAEDQNRQPLHNSCGSKGCC
ncbi:hypothetical protein GDO78_008137 [Eleutherodactylus coqui]|uniref:Arsenite methyltransferase n=1 Tax=Eleutherodactylus coqui TaxID=57060 RepID=A0A8J6FD76_ELECQ|nr:hypothetical protein GDO78_008137 [Eleutherodactylus coqui]